MSIAPVLILAGGDGGEHPRRRGEVGDEQDLGEAPVECVQGRARVEPEPPQPQDQDAQPEQRHAVARDRARPAIPPYLPFRGAEQQQGGERSAGADQVDGRGAGEVLHPDDRGAQPVAVLQEAAAEHPVGADRVDDRREDRRVDDVDAELDPLQGRAPDDRQGDGAEDELEEPLRLDRRVGERHHREAGVEQGHAVGGRAVRAEVGEEEAPVVPDEAAQRATEGEREADRPPAIAAMPKLVRIFATTVPAFLALEKPISRKAKPACMNITSEPATITHIVLMPTDWLELAGDRPVEIRGVGERRARYGQQGQRRQRQQREIPSSHPCSS